MHYTIHQDDKIDQKIEQDMKYIVQEIRNLLGDKIHSILLSGGFGRGEGAVEIKNEKIRIVNDYDIRVVLREKNWLKYALLYKKFHSELEKLSQRLAKELKMKQIDIDLKHLSYFSNQPLKIENYELRKGHLLLYGQQDPCQHIPNYEPKDIPLFEGIRLFGNRGAGLILAGRYFLNNQGVVSEENRENFVIECNKAIIAIGDSILLLKQQYHYLHQRRKEIIQELKLRDIPNISEIIPCYLEAIEQKLKPNFEKFYCRDMVEWWFKIIGIFDKFYRYFESQRLGINFNEWTEYAELKKPGDRLDKRKLFGTLIRGEINPFSVKSVRRNALKARKYGLINLMALLLFSVRKDGFYQPYLEKAAKMLALKMSKDSLRGWLQLTSIFFRLWHPKGEIGRVLEERCEG